MGAAAYNRGSRAISRELDGLMPAAIERAERQALRDEIARLRARNETLSRQLARACRCLAAERLGREKRVAELKAELNTAKSAISILCRLAFPKERTNG